MDFGPYDDVLSPGSASAPSVDNQSLCDCCLRVFAADNAFSIPHHESVDHLIRCATYDCLLCAGMWNEIPREHQALWVAADDALNGFRPTQIFCQVLSYSSETLYIEYTSQTAPHGDRAQDRYQLYLNRHLQHEANRASTDAQPHDGSRHSDGKTLRGGGSEPDSHRRKPQRSFERTFNANSSFFINRRLDECRALHPNCNIGRVTAWLPTRLVAIGAPGQPPHLVLGQSIPTESVYVTLSHCWGVRRTIELRQDLLAAFFQEIPLVDIPKTYRDAMDVARSLDIWFIWIDSLCIIQDSPDDWTPECSAMCNVYRNGLCNIAAVESPDSEGGCFRQRDAALLEPLVIQSSWGPLSGLLHKNGLWRWVFQSTPRLIYQELDSSALHQRGWVLQERILSPRTLHFGRHMVYWQCRTTIESETIEESFKTLNQRYWPCIIPTGEPRIEILDETQNGGYLPRWAILLENYTRGRLTYPQDKLVAISALAKQFHSVFEARTNGTDLRYIAGVWTLHLAPQLVWRRQGDKYLVRPPHYRAPSWSWASVDGPLDFLCISWPGPQWESNILADVVEAEAQAAGSDPYLAVVDGFLRLSCWLWKLKPDPAGGYQSGAIELVFDMADSRVSEKTRLLPVKLYVLGKSFDPYSELHGLIVEENAGIFARIGYFSYETRRDDPVFKERSAIKSTDIEFLARIIGQVVTFDIPTAARTSPPGASAILGERQVIKIA
jgi:hypothetical protein